MTPDQALSGQGSAKKAGGVAPTLTANDLIASVPGIEKLADIRAETLSNIASANITFQMIQMLCERASTSDADAIVVTQGTDTMEETSFLTKLLYRGAKPIIFTGAMRSPNQLSSDGAANLYSAVLAATKCNASGVFVVMDNHIHDPSYVEKTHTWALDAFKSEYSVAGYVSEGHVFWHAGTDTCTTIAPFDFSTVDVMLPVAHVPITLDDQGQILDMVHSQYAGVVIDAYGAGHVSEIWADKLVTLNDEMPVVFASQAHNGRVLDSTYGYKGAEIDLIAKGLIPSGFLSAKKARLLLSLLISKKTSDIKKSFTEIVERLRI